MNGRVFAVIHFQRRGASYLAAALYDDGELLQLSVRPYPDPTLIGNVYLGKAESSHPEIGGCFVRIGEETCFLPDRSVKPGTELLVQVTKDAVGAKKPCVSAKLSLTGTYAVAEEGSGISYSRHLSKARKAELAPLAEETGCRITFRTACADAHLPDIRAEIGILTGTIRALRERETMRTAFSLLHTPPAFYADMYTRLRGGAPDRIVTDDPTAYGELRSRAGAVPVSYYDDAFPLAKLYNLERDVERLLETRVHLKSGAELVIEQTEAFVSIDVNSSKKSSGKDPELTYLAVNLEAAGEAARQIRLRNLSGIILIDFINMRRAENNAALLAKMKEHLAEDPLTASAVDITALGIMEIVRKRTQKTLAAQLLP